jgi:hypothetical protein
VDSKPGEPKRRNVREGARVADPIEIGLDGLESRGFDGFEVHEARIEIADLLLRCARRGLLRGRLFDDAVHAFARGVIEHDEAAIAGPILGNRERVVPLAVGEAEEVIARFHAGLTGAEIETEMADGRART